MIIQFVELLKGLPKEWIVLIASAIPVIEVRGSIPLGMMYFKMPALNAILLSILGSSLIALPLFWFLNTMTVHLRKINAFDKFFEWLFARTRAKSKMIEDLELIGLTLFIAVPLPGTGVWTGVIAAYLLGLRWLPTFFAASVGTSLASIAVWAATAGLIKLFF